MDKYLNLFTDFGFKKIFGEELNKDILIDFLYLEMPKFEKTEAELDSHFDKWLFILKNLHNLKY